MKIAGEDLCRLEVGFVRMGGTNTGRGESEYSFSELYNGALFLFTMLHFSVAIFMGLPYPVRAIFVVIAPLYCCTFAGLPVSRRNNK